MKSSNEGNIKRWEKRIKFIKYQNKKNKKRRKWRWRNENKEKESFESKEKYKKKYRNKSQIEKEVGNIEKSIPQNERLLESKISRKKMKSINQVFKIVCQII